MCSPSRASLSSSSLSTCAARRRCFSESRRSRWIPAASASYRHSSASSPSTAAASPSMSGLGWVTGAAPYTAYSRSEGAAKRSPAIPPAPALAADHARPRPDRGLAGAADHLLRGNTTFKRGLHNTVPPGDSLVPPSEHVLLPVTARHHVTGSQRF